MRKKKIGVEFLMNFRDNFKQIDQTFRRQIDSQHNFLMGFEN